MKPKKKVSYLPCKECKIGKIETVLTFQQFQTNLLIKKCSNCKHQYKSIEELF